MTVRVAPREAIAVPFECGGQTFTGRLADVSINGLGILLPAAQAAPIRPRAVARLTLTLPEPSGATLNLSGTVRFVRHQGELSRVGIVFVQDVQMLTLLHYVRDRQTEILAELQALYESRPPAS
jgi:hypothetical protein